MRKHRMFLDCSFLLRLLSILIAIGLGDSIAGWVEYRADFRLDAMV